jgi:hypothetical protein
VNYFLYRRNFAAWSNRMDDSIEGLLRESDLSKPFDSSRFDWEDAWRAAYWIEITRSPDDAFRWWKFMSKEKPDWEIPKLMLLVHVWRQNLKSEESWALKDVQKLGEHDLRDFGLFVEGKADLNQIRAEAPIHGNDDFIFYASGHFALNRGDTNLAVMCFREGLDPRYEGYWGQLLCWHELDRLGVDPRRFTDAPAKALNWAVNE